MSFASQIEDRPQLAEDLWLLRTLRFTKPASKWPELGRDDHQRLVLSDAVALYLTTDEPDGLVAAFYMPENNILYLAKSGSSDPQYVTESTLFFDTLTSANGSEDLLPFLARRSCNRINKRIRKLCHSFDFSHIDLLHELKEYEPTETEFHGPWYRIFIKILQAENQLDTPSFKQVLIHAITFCNDRLEKNPEFSDKTESHRPFFELLCAASTLLNSQFYERFERGFNTQLERRLEKLVDYLAIHQKNQSAVNTNLSLKVTQSEGIWKQESDTNAAKRHVTPFFPLSPGEIETIRDRDHKQKLFKQLTFPTLDTHNLVNSQLSNAETNRSSEIVLNIPHNPTITISLASQVEDSACRRLVASTYSAFY
ncbi:hypothetical protein E4T56_gene11456 [Termitomyces sp. T112]|nr:hypothetical protein E4T56_gene11456 [Termitomyces sp. T112]